MNDKSLFTEIFDWNPINDSHRNVKLANGQKVPIAGVGHIDFMMENTRIIIPDVLYVPQLQSNLFSVQKHIEF